MTRKIPATALPILADAFASKVRPVVTGRTGAIAAAHPLAVTAGQEMLLSGGSAVDAVIAAQAVLCVVAPDACGLGGDALCLVREPGGDVVAINGSGAIAQELGGSLTDGGGSVTVPGIVDAWDKMAERWSRLPFERLLEPARRIARGGMVVSPRLARAVAEQHGRLMAGGAGEWALVRAQAGDVVVQNGLAQMLDRIGKERAAAYYAGRSAEAIVAAVRAHGGNLSLEDLARHETVLASPVTTSWDGVTVHVQPPVTQGVLLAMCLAELERLGPVPPSQLDHVAIELTEASFAFRDRAGEGAALLDERLVIDPAKPLHRGGPRAYLHTAGVAASDERGLTVSSLVSVFDDFGSAVFVPQGGFVLNNRAGGFTTGPNAPAPGRRPVHTLAPVIVETERGPLALATPGADGQIQTLLQALLGAFRRGADLASTVAAPRWRSEDGRILIEESHPGAEALAALGHRIERLPDGHMKFGALVVAGHLDERPAALADWRRETWAGVV